MTHDTEYDFSAEALRHFLRSAYGVPYTEMLGMLFRLLQEMPCDQRRKLFPDALLLMPSEFWITEPDVDLARALIGDGIVQLIGAPLSAQTLRRLGAKAADRSYAASISYMPLTSEWEIHVLMMELARSVLLPVEKKNSSAADDLSKPSPNRKQPHVATHLERVWPTLPPHVRDAIWTIVQAACPTADFGDTTAPPPAQPDETVSY